MSIETTLPDGAETTRVWLGIVRVAAVVLVVWSAVLQFTVGTVIPPVLAVGVVFAALNHLAGDRSTLGRLGSDTLPAAVGGNVPSMVEELTHPSSALAFILTLIATTAGVVLMVSGLAAIFVGRRNGDS